MSKPRPKAKAAKEKLSKTVKIRRIQRILGVKVDGVWGPLTQAALDELIQGKLPAAEGDVHRVVASSFADPADVAAFARCKAQGKSDSECFKVGDNGKGCWGDDTTEGSGPCCALPPEDMEETWGSVNAAHLKPVMVIANNRDVVCEVKDRMPHRKNIKNGTGIDLNPDACEELGLNPPIKTPATWQSMIEA